MAYQKTLKHYREQVDSYSREDVKKMDNLVGKFLEEWIIPHDYKEAIAYFYMCLHLLEYDKK